MSAQHVKTDKLDRIIDCLVFLADKGANTTEESKLSRWAELTVLICEALARFPLILVMGRMVQNWKGPWGDSL